MSHPQGYYPPPGHRPPPAPKAKVERPADVDTGFWLWVIALPLMSISYTVDAVSAPNSVALGIALSLGILVVVDVLVITFLILMRSGYRWTRTVLTAGGLASIVTTVFGLFAEGRPPWAAVSSAATGIIGVVLIAGGVYLLHRKESHEFFTR